MNDIQVLQSSQLFEGIEPGQIQILLGCLHAAVNTYQKGEFILHRGEPTRRMGIVLEGTAHIIKEDFWGNRVILGPSGPGQLFAESYACLGSENLAVSVVAATTARVMFLDVVSLFQSCTTACDFHTRMIRNLTRVLAGRNLMLTQKVEHMAQKTTREKLLSYLSAESIRQSSLSFDIPFDRQQLADFLCVERAAMSVELSKLQREGLLVTKRNHFELLTR